MNNDKSGRKMELKCTQKGNETKAHVTHAVRRYEAIRKWKL
jgi:hypothetical protein